MLNGVLKSDKNKIAVIVVTGLLFRLIFYLFEKNSPLFLYPIIDESEFLSVSDDIISFGFLYPYHFFHPPFFSYFLAVIKAIGFGLNGIVLIQFMIGIAGAGLLFLSLQGFDKKIAFITALIWGAYPLELFIETRFLSESVFIFLNILLLFILTRSETFKSKYFLAGLLTGLIVITKSQFLIFWLLFIIFSLYNKKPGIKKLVVYASAALLLPLLFVIHNAFYTHGKLISISSNGAINLYIGNSHDIDSTLNIRPQSWQSDFFPSLYDEAGIKFYKNDSTDTRQTYPYLLSGFLIKKTFLENKNPVTPIKNLFRKTLVTLHPYETPRDFDLYEYRRWNPYLKFTVQGKLIFMPLALFLFAALLFLFLQWKKLIKQPTGLLLLLFILVNLLPSILFFNASRYRLAAVPFLLFFGIKFYKDYFKNRKWMVINLLLIAILGSPLLKSLRFQKIPKSETYTYYADGFLAKGKERQADRFYSMAIKEAKKEPHRKKRNATAYINKGVLSNKLGNKQASLNELNEAVSADPSSAMAYYNRAIAKHQLKKFDPAINDYTQAINLGFDDDFYLAASYYGRALSYVQLNQFENALADLDKSIEINASNPVAYSNRGVLLGRFNRLSEALEDFTRAIQLDSTNFKYYTDRAIAYLNKSETENAFRDIQDAIRLNPTDGKSYYIRGLLKLDFGKQKAACKDLQQALDLGFEAARNDLAKYCP